MDTKWLTHCLAITFVLLCGTMVSAADKPNILFIAIDDLRPELGCYGSEIAVSPHLDRLASEGLLFNRAYCQEAICAPSRASLLTGTRPDTTGVTHNYIRIREASPDILTLPQHFRNNGYETVYCGKIFHGGDTDDDISWSRQPDINRLPSYIPKKPVGFALPENLKARNKSFKEMLAKYGEAARRGLASGPAYESADVEDYVYPDGFNTELAIATLKDMVEEGDKPFFLGLGLIRPHLNWVAPKKYWDLYTPEDIPLASQQNAPVDGAAMGLHASFELRTRHDIPKYGPIKPELARTLKHAYLACVSYVDAQIGKMIAAIEDAGVKENTIIIVWSDHGWHLGDMGVWGKATNYEIATRVPMMIWTPGMSKRGRSTDALVELADIFPTLCELANLPVPAHVEGHSFVPLLSNPQRSWKKAAFSQFPSPALREWAANPLSDEMRQTFFGPLIDDVEEQIIEQQGERWNRELFEQHLMGYAIRTDRFRLVEWRDRRHADAEPIFVELYDHETDPQETINIANDHPQVVESLSKQLAAGWKSAL
nr:sulfatase [Calycomorphotria hydatis]